MDRNTRKLTRASSSSPSASLQRLLSMQTQMKGITRCHDSITGLFVWKKNIILYHAIFLFRLPWLFIQHLQHHFAQQQLFLLSCLHKTFQEHFRCKRNNFPCVPFYVSTFSLRTKHKKNRRQSSNEQLNLLSFRHQDKGPHFFVDWKSVVFTTVADSSKSWQSITSPSLSSCLWSLLTPFVNSLAWQTWLMARQERRWERKLQQKHKKIVKDVSSDRLETQNQETGTFITVWPWGCCLSKNKRQSLIHNNYPKKNKSFSSNV